MKLRVGISPCPNDTFAFHGDSRAARRSPRSRHRDRRSETCSSSTTGWSAVRFDLSKASFHQALLLTDRFGVMRAGSALGFGVGPLLVSAEPGLGPSPHARVLCPGATTTATLALPLPASPPGRRSPRRVLGHRRRATARQRRHRRADPRGPADLRARRADPARRPRHVVRTARRRSGAARRHPGVAQLPRDVVDDSPACCRSSISYAWANREETLPTIRAHAQEMGEDVIWPYVELYVNDNTFDLGAEGERSLTYPRASPGIDAGRASCRPAAAPNPRLAPQTRIVDVGRRTSARAVAGASVVVKTCTS